MAETQYGTFHKRTSTAEFLSSTDWIQYIDTTGDTASTSNEYTPNKNNSLTKYLRTLAANVAGISGNTINNGTVGQLAYYSAQGTLSGYTGVTTAQLKTISDWFDTVKDTDTDANINRWNEIVDFLNNFTEADTLASILSTYVTLGSEQTITGVKTFSNPISGDILGNATTADRLKSTTAVGSASLPVYFTGGLPVVCTASSIFSALSSDTTNAVSITVCGQTRNITPSTLRTSLGLGTVYSHAHTDYVTNVSFDDTNRKLQQSKGDGTATDIVTFGTGAFATIADYLPLSGGTMTGSITFPQTSSSAYLSSGIKWSDYTAIASNTVDSLGIYAGNQIYFRPGVSTDYTKGVVVSRTNLTYNGNEVLTAGNYTDYVNSTNFPVLGYTLSGVNNRTINSSTAGYAAYYSATSTVSGTSLLQFDTTNSVTTIKGTGASPLEVWARSGSSSPLYWSTIKFISGNADNKTTLGYIGIGGPNSTSVMPNRPFWSITGSANDSYQLVHSLSKTVSNVRTSAVGSTGTPVYVDNNGEVQSCVVADLKTTLSLSAAINSSTAGYCAYYSDANTISGNSLLQFGTSVITVKSSSSTPFEIYYSANNSASSISFYSGTTKTLNGSIGIGGSGSSSISASRPYWYNGTTYYQIVHSTAKTAIGSATTAPVYIDTNGQAKVCTSLNINTSGTAAGLSATIANDKLPARLQANHTTNTADPTECGWYYASSGASGAPFGSTDFLIMAQGYSASWATEIATDFRSNNLAVRNKNNGTWNSWNIMVGTLGNQTITGNKTFTGTTTIDSLTSTSITTSSLTASGTVNLSGSTTIDSLTAGNLVVNGNSSLTSNVSMGTVTAGIWNGSIIDVAHGGTGCSTLTSGYALVGNGTEAVQFRNIHSTTTAGSLANATTWAQNTGIATINTIAYWDGSYQSSNHASNLEYCKVGKFGDIITKTTSTAISTATGTASATNNNYNSDTYIPTNKAVYNFVTSTLGVTTTIVKSSITKSLNSSTWTETGYTLWGEEQGSYMLQITDTTTGAIFTGVFSIYHGSSATGNDLDEIPLHMCASATNKVRIYAATQNGKLLVSSQDTSATNHTLTIKYKKLI